MNEAMARLFGCVTDWGPGMLVAALIIYVAYQLVYRLGKDVGLKIVSALEKPSDALTMQAKSMDQLTHVLEDYVGRDKSEHREIIILQKVTNERMEYLLEKIEELRK